MPFIAGCSKYALGTWAKNNVPTDSLRTSLTAHENQTLFQMTFSVVSVTIVMGVPPSH